MNNMKYNSLEEWKNAYPKDYDYAVYKKMLPFICEKMGWELPSNNLIKSFNELKELKLIELYEQFLETEKEFNIVKIKNNKASSARFRAKLRILKRQLKTVKRDISSLA